MKHSHLISRFFCYGFSLGMALNTLALHAADISPISDLKHDSQLAKKTGRPIVLFVTASYCEYCEVLREEIFQFLPNDSRFILREVIKDDTHNSIINFDGEKTNAPDIAKKYGIFLTPTVLFVDADGKQLSEPLVGVITLDFYSYYFDQNVSQSTQMLQQRAISGLPVEQLDQAIN